jgi:hypothetical protein
MPQLDIAAVRRAVEENRYLITQHAQQRIGLHRIRHADIKYVVTDGDVVEQHPDNKPDPKALFMAYVEGRPLYVSCAFDGNRAYIITVHRYDPERWLDPWTRRKE